MRQRGALFIAHAKIVGLDRLKFFFNVFWGKCMYLFISQQLIIGLNSVYLSLRLACFQKQAQFNRGVTLFDQCHIKATVAAICYETYRITRLPSWPQWSVRSLQKTQTLSILNIEKHKPV